MEERIDHLAGEDLARRQGQRVVFTRDMLNSLRRRELKAAAAKIGSEAGLQYRSLAGGEHVAGTYRQRLNLS